MLHAELILAMDKEIFGRKNQTCQVSRSYRETHDFLLFLTISRLSTEISRFSRKSIEDLFTIGKRWTNPNFEGID